MCGNEGCGMVVHKKDKENHESNVCKFRIINCYDCRDVKPNQDEIMVGLNFAAFLAIIILLKILKPIQHL